MSDYPPGPSDPGAPGSTPPPPPPPGGTGGWGSTPPPPPGAPGGYGYPPPGAPMGPGGAGGYSVGSAFSWAFSKFGRYWAPLVLVTLVLLVGSAIVQGIQRAVLSAPDSGDGLSGGFFGVAMILSMLFSAASWVVQLIVQSVIVKGSLDVTRGRPLELGSATSGIDWGQVIIASLIIGVMTFIGLLLCILPGIAVIFFTFFTLFFVIDRGEDAVTAIKSSFTLVKSNAGVLFLFFLAQFALLIVGLCLCFVGLLVAIPVVVLAQAYTFRILTGEQVAA